PGPRWASDAGGAVRVRDLRCGHRPRGRALVLLHRPGAPAVRVRPDLRPDHRPHGVHRRLRHPVGADTGGAGPRARRAVPDAAPEQQLRQRAHLGNALPHGDLVPVPGTAADRRGEAHRLARPPAATARRRGTAARPGTGAWLGGNGGFGASSCTAAGRGGAGREPGRPRPGGRELTPAPAGGRGGLPEERGEAGGQGPVHGAVGGDRHAVRRRRHAERAGAAGRPGPAPRRPGGRRHLLRRGGWGALSGAERRRLVEVVVGCCRGKCPVLAHTGHHSAAETIELTRHAVQAGADFAVVINPYYPPASDEGLYRWFEHVCANVDIGVWLFDTGYSGVSLSTELIRRLAAIENVCGIKVGRSHVRYLELLKAVGDTILVCSPPEETWRPNMPHHVQRACSASASP